MKKKSNHEKKAERTRDKVLTIIKQLLITILGSAVIGIAINLFYVPAGILGGGLTAIAILLNALIGTNVAYVTLLMNIPVLIAGYFFVDRHFMIFSTIGMFIMTAVIRLTQDIPTPSDNIITCIVAGAICIGVGAGLALRQNSSCGGLDVIARILYKYYSIPMGNTSLMVNAVILAVGCYFLGLDMVVFTILAIFISGRVINYMVEGINYKRTVFIVSEMADEIATALMEEFGKGVTITEAVGAYSGEHQKQIMCAINPYQTPKLRNIVLKLDSRAFVTITESISVIGGGFADKRLD